MPQFHQTRKSSTSKKTIFCAHENLRTLFYRKSQHTFMTCKSKGTLKESVHGVINTETEDAAVFCSVDLPNSNFVLTDGSGSYCK